jgi:hypothetical protein
LAQGVHVLANEQNLAGAQAKILKQQETDNHCYTSTTTQYQQAMARTHQKQASEGVAPTAGDAVASKKKKKTRDEMVAGTSNVSTEGKSPPSKKKKKTDEAVAESTVREKKAKRIHKKSTMAKAKTATMELTEATAALRNAMEKELTEATAALKNAMEEELSNKAPASNKNAAKSSENKTAKPTAKQNISPAPETKRKKRSATPEEKAQNKKKKPESTSQPVVFANLLSKVEFVEADKSEEEDENLSIEQLLRNAIRDVKSNQAFYDMEVKEEEKNEIGKLCSYIQDVESLRNEAQSNHSASKLPMWDFKASKPREMLHAMQSVNIWLINFCIASKTAIGNDKVFTKMLAVYVGKLSLVYV